MALHEITLKVVVLMDEMDGTSEESALIALDLAVEALENIFPSGANVVGYGADEVIVSVADHKEIWQSVTE